LRERRTCRHFGDYEPGAKPDRHTPERRVRDPGHWGKNDAIGRNLTADRER
jgi:hypothetical protein